MANDFKGTTWVLDTVGIIHTQPLFVKTVKLIAEAAVAGANILVTDPLNGGTLWEEVAPGPNFSTQEMIEKWWPNGLTLVSLGGIAGAKLIIDLG